MNLVYNKLYFQILFKLTIVHQNSNSFGKIDSSYRSLTIFFRNLQTIFFTKLMITGFHFFRKIFHDVFEWDGSGNKSFHSGILFLMRKLKHLLQENIFSPKV